MVLNVFIGNQPIQIDIPPKVACDGHEFFAHIDQDMDKGWKIGPTYVESPTKDMRIQIVADRLLAALETKKVVLIELLAGYILHSDPTIKAVKIDTDGEPLNTVIVR